MTVTAPLATTDELIIGDDLPVVIPDPVTEATKAIETDDYSILRDPIVPFLLVGVATLLTMVVMAFLLTAPVA